MTARSGSAYRVRRVTAAIATGFEPATPVDSVSSGATDPSTGRAVDSVPCVLVTAV